MKGFGLVLCSTTKRLMAACRSTTETKTPRFNRRLVSFAKSHRQIQVFDLAVRRMISFVPSPSAVSKTISARQTCFCEALRSATNA